MSIAVNPEPVAPGSLRTVRDDHTPVRPLAALRVPLVVKLIGANVIAVALLAAAWRYFGSAATSAEITVVIGVALATYFLLMLVALQPVHDLESLALRVWKGDYAARYRDSLVADKEVLRVGSMFNTLLDGLSADRARMRQLAEEVVAVGDRERAALARELHDSTAQRLAALLLQISAIAREEKDADRAARLNQLRDAAQQLTEEVRLLASSVHPRVLDDLGIVAALRKLARDTSRAAGIDVKLSGPDLLPLAQPVASVLYRVANEATRNAIAHSGAKSIHIALQRSEDLVSVEVTDNGTGFDVPEAMRRRPGMGLFTMRERVSLVDGTFEIRSDNTGTTVAAIIPLPTSTQGD